MPRLTAPKMCGFFWRHALPQLGRDQHFSELISGYAQAPDSFKKKGGAAAGLPDLRVRLVEPSAPPVT